MKYVRGLIKLLLFITIGSVITLLASSAPIAIVLDNIFIKPRLDTLNSKSAELLIEKQKDDESFLTFHEIPILPLSKNKEFSVETATNELLPTGESYLVKTDDVQSMLNVEKNLNINQLVQINGLGKFLRFNEVAHMSFSSNKPQYSFLHPLDNYAVFCCRLIKAIAGSPKNSELFSIVYTEKQFIMYYVLTKNQKPPLLFIEQYDTDSYYTIIIMANPRLKSSKTNNINHYRAFVDTIISYASFVENNGNKNIVDWLYVRPWGEQAP